MARLRTVVTTEGEIALAVATAKTILQIVAPTNQRIAVRAFSVSFDGTSGTAEPVVVEIMRQTSAGTSLVSATVYKEDGLGSETIQMTAQKGAAGAQTDPTPSDILRRYSVHPQTGAEWKFALDEEIIVPGGGRLGIRCTAPAIVNAQGHFACEE